MNCSLSMFLRSLGLLCAVTATHFRLTILQSRWNSPKIRRRSTSWLKRNLLLTVVGTVEARDTSRDMDNVQMISTKITAIKEYLYVRHPHCTSFIASTHLVILRLDQSSFLNPNKRQSLTILRLAYADESNFCWHGRSKFSSENYIITFNIDFVLTKVEFWDKCYIRSAKCNLKRRASPYFELQNFARTHSPTRLMSSENTYSLSREHCNLKYSGKWSFLHKYSRMSQRDLLFRR